MQDNNIIKINIENDRKEDNKMKIEEEKKEININYNNNINSNIIVEQNKENMNMNLKVEKIEEQTIISNQINTQNKTSFVLPINYKELRLLATLSVTVDKVEEVTKNESKDVDKKE